MLYILTGDVQIGKTRWLQALVSDLEARGAVCDGVIAPGVWREDEAGGFDKLGIDNELLPTHEVVHFARRDDLARAEGTFDANAQSAKAMLRWHISDEAIRKVNAHFDALIEAAKEPQAADMPECTCVHTSPAKRMLIVDEMGRLELLCNEGLTSAMELLKHGPEERYECALLVARDMFDSRDALCGRLERLQAHLPHRRSAQRDRRFRFKPLEPPAAPSTPSSARRTSLSSSSWTD